MKVSFLIAAHNEEKIIRKTLENLLNLPYEDYEVIIGLDGCTDKTEDILKEYCKKSKRFRYFSLNLRQGKPAVVDFIIKKAIGDIIVINDADWIFDFRNKKSLTKYFSFFNNEKIGGITEPLPIEWSEKMQKANIGYRMVAFSAYFWMDFQKNKYSVKKNNIRYLKEPALFMTNVFRKNLYKRNKLLGDDFERTAHIMKSGFEVVLIEDPKMPRMNASYDKIRIRDLFKQKIRTAKARAQLKKENLGVDFSYLFWANIHILRESFKRGFSIFVLCVFWIFLTSIATVYSYFRSFDTKEGWKLRAKR